MITGVHAVGLAASEPEAALATFGAAVPLERVDGLGGLLARGLNLHLTVEQASAAVPLRAVHQAGLAHICVQQRDMGRLRPALEGAGVAFLSPPVDLGTGYLYAYGRTPDGVLLETEAAPFAPAELDGWFGHIALVTSDLERLAGFYADWLGRPRPAPMRLRGSRRYAAVTGLDGVDVLAAWVSGLNLTLEFWRYLNPATFTEARPEDAPGWTHVTFESDDVVGDVARAAALGAEVEAPAALAREGEVARLRDPDGNRMRLVCLNEEHAHLSVARLPCPDVLARVQAARAAAAA